ADGREGCPPRPRGQGADARGRRPRARGREHLRPRRRAERAGDRGGDPEGARRCRGRGRPAREAPRARERRIRAVSATVSAVIAQRPAQGGKPSITYRYAGDRAVLVEYGEMEFDLTLNFFVLAVDEALREDRPDG